MPTLTTVRKAARELEAPLITLSAIRFDGDLVAWIEYSSDLDRAVVELADGRLVEVSGAAPIVLEF